MFEPHDFYENEYFYSSEGKGHLEITDKDSINLNLNLFLRLLGATNEIIFDDKKTLEFMISIKNRIDEPLVVDTDAFMEVSND
jgi:hypothetical protein